MFLSPPRLLTPIWQCGFVLGNPRTLFWICSYLCISDPQSS
jgi:hypothetical protein